jgi:glycosyltransferase involved in cell wall biosynthesis
MIRPSQCSRSEKKTVVMQMKNTPAGGNLRAAMVTYQFPPMFAGGARHALELAKALRRRGVESFFIGANLKNAPGHENYEGFPVFRFTPRGPGRIRYLTYALQACKKLCAEKDSVDIIHLHSIRPFYFLIFALAKLLKKPIVLSPTLIGHDDPMTLKKKPFLWQVEGKLYGRYGKIVCKSTAIKDSCARAGIPDSLIAAIPGAVPCAESNSPFRPAQSPTDVKETRAALGLPPDSFIVTFVGHIQERKGCDLLFEAWRELLKEKRFSGHLVLVGPYPSDRERDGFVARLRPVLETAAEKRILFTGQVNYADVPGYLRASDCFVFPSKREGLSKAVIEAMACGLPVICANIPGVTGDMIDHGEDGIVLDRRDAAVWARTILRLHDDDALRHKLSANAIRKVRDKFSIAEVARRHQELYRELVNRAH